MSSPTAAAGGFAADDPDNHISWTSAPASDADSGVDGPNRHSQPKRRSTTALLGLIVLMLIAGAALTGMAAKNMHDKKEAERNYQAPVAADIGLTQAQLDRLAGIIPGSDETTGNGNKTTAGTADGSSDDPNVRDSDKDGVPDAQDPAPHDPKIWLPAGWIPPINDPTSDWTAPASGSQPSSVVHPYTNTTASAIAKYGPNQLVVPALGRHGRVVYVSISRGFMQVPGAQEAGLWHEGAKPGKPGASMFVGHVDNYVRQGGLMGMVYALQPGMTVWWNDAKGTPHRFVVVARTSYNKHGLPSSLFSQSGPARTYLVTCSGKIETRPDGSRHYVNNMVATVIPA